VFDSIEDFHNRIDDDHLDVDESSVMVLRNCGPRGYPGMPEVGNMPLPPKLLRRGIKDMVRISDARMSGTAYGTVVLHVAPEGAAGGPLAAVRDGDIITIDVPARSIRLDISDEEMAARLARWTPPPLPARGWERIYVTQVNQADEGVDLEMLVGSSGAGIPRESH
jgi:L-arabonate dehydrase